MPNQTMGMTQDQRLQMILAPQLRQSLEMLQAPVLELRAMIRAELERNPTLEEITTSPVPEEAEAAPAASQVEDHKELDFRKEFETLMRLDDEWKDYFLQERGAVPWTPQDQEKRDFWLDSIPQRVSLQEHLVRQLGLAELSESDRELGNLIIGSINDDGYLTTPVENLATTSGVDPAHLKDILDIVREFDPPGIGAVDLRECLLQQLERLGKQESLAASIVRDHIGKLAGKKYPEIARALHVTAEEVQQAANFIATLNPKPGGAYSSELSPYVLPEVIVRKMEGEYRVFLNDDGLPRVRISKYYRSLLSDADTNADVRGYVQERIRSGAFLIRSIHQRQQTIQRIATEIVRVQTEFLDKGIAHLKPLTMAEVADAVSLHETTVSRAVAGKHMQTPVGTFEMRYFFTPGLKMSDGQDISNKTVKSLIGQILAEEDPSHPLSDQEILEMLTKRGIQIARRTIAKYRVAMRIPPSHLRRTY